MLNPVTTMQPKHALSIAVAAIVLAQSNVVAAEDKIVVTGQSVSNTSVIDQDTLDKFQAADLEDVFRHNPEVSVGGGFSTAQKIYLRGIEDTNLNVSIDGAMQAGYLFHHQGRVSIEPELLKQVEVQAGAGLATDGPGALGGAIRFTTKDPEDLLRDGEQFGVTTKLGYFSNTNGLKLNANFFGRLSDNVSVLTSLTRQDADNIVDGNGTEQADTKSDITSGLFKIVGNISEDQTVRLSHDFRHDDGTRNVRPHFIAAGWNQANKQESHRDTTNLQYNLNPENSDIDLQANVYYTKSYITQHPTDGSKDGAGVKSYGLDVRNTQQLANHQLTYGLDYRKDFGYYINPTDPINDEELHVAGLYLQDKIKMSEQLIVNTGVRYDHYDLKDDGGQTFKSDGLSPNLGFIYLVNDTLTLRGGYAEALRGTSVKEAYLLGWSSYDPNIKEQEADNLEFGFDYNENRFSAGATIYTGRIKNAVARVRNVGITNVGDVKTKGVSAYLAYSWDNTDLNLAYSYNRPELDGEPLSDGNMSVGTATGDTLTASVTHMIPQHNIELGWSAELVKRLSDVPADRVEKSGYNVHDVYARWYPRGNEDLSLTLTVKNLFDKQYLNHASYGVSTSSGTILGLEEPGRDIRLTLATRF